MRYLTRFNSHSALIFSSLALALLLSTHINASELPPNIEPDAWELTLEDKFDGDNLNTSIWSKAPEWSRQDGTGRWSNDDSYLDGKGHLIINIRNDNGTIKSGAIRTSGKFKQKYGYFEIRATAPAITGAWTAFWLMPAGGNKPGNTGNDGTEIDIMETINGDKGKINHALHWDGYGDQHQSKSFSLRRPNIYDGKFHDFALQWNENEYVFYIDNIETWRTSAGNVSDVAQYMKITAETAAWAGNIFSENLPKKWKIDHIRVYKAKIDTQNPLDSDNDGFLDSDEIANGWDPLDPRSPPYSINGRNHR